MKVDIVVDEVSTPIGLLCALFSPAGLVRLDFSSNMNAADEAQVMKRFPGVAVRLGKGGTQADDLRRQLESYFEGSRHLFDIDLDLRGPHFFLKVWRALLRINYGSTVTYGGLALRVGGSARAVGSACASNPVPVIIPCHRVVGRDGSLRGYGGGVGVKRFLLELEGARMVRQGLIINPYD